MSPSFEAALTYRDDALAFLREPVRTLRRTLPGEGASGAFGLVEGGAEGWTLFIPDGATAVVTIEEEPLDLASVTLEPSGERRVRLREGLRARISMGGFCFEVCPSA